MVKVLGIPVLLLVLCMSSARGAEGEFVVWRRTTFTHSQRIWMDGRSFEKDVKNLQVLVRLTPERFDYSASAPDGSDLAFFDAGAKARYAHEIESWNPAGESCIWVKVPLLEAGRRDNVLLLCCGADRKVSALKAHRVWNRVFLVHHGESPLVDVSKGGTSLALNGNVGVTDEGFAGSSLVFMPDEQGQLLTDVTSLPKRYTFSTWIWWAGQVPGSAFPRLFQKQDGDALAVTQCFINHKRTSGLVGAIRLQQNYQNGGSDFWSSVPVSERRWVHVTIAVNNKGDTPKVEFYFNGVRDTESYDRNGASGGVVDDAGPVMLYNRQDGARQFQGMVDESRFAMGLRSPDWIKASYLAECDRLLDFIGPDIEIAAQQESYYSPAYLEGLHGNGYQTTVRAAGEPVAVTELGGQRFFAYLPCDETGVAFEVENEVGTTVAGTVTWKAIDLAEVSELAVPTGSTIKVAGVQTSPPAIFEGCGVYSGTVTYINGAWRVAFPSPGIFDVSDGAGNSCTISVYGATPRSDVACKVDYRRWVQLNTGATGDGLEFASGDERHLVIDDEALWYEKAGASFVLLRAVSKQEALLVARMPGSGPVVCAQKIIPYTLSSNFAHGYVYTLDDNGYGHGTFTVTMDPPVPHHKLTVDFFHADATVNGELKFTLDTDEDLDEDGSWSGKAVIEPNTSVTCHTLKVEED